ncbi:hypothetical protein RI543_001139 [Arxiozyma heterogenica]|uniref:Uncharacterized protein n=1 Tax=Arxiozyma heterogenica TaxID=278026 RepID=A0AAN7WM53_9SACH|nr:hypothetical protein RI543_001139 [Kazachstania heterogenica]
MEVCPGYPIHKDPCFQHTNLDTQPYENNNIQRFNYLFYNKVHSITGVIVDYEDAL